LAKKKSKKPRNKKNPSETYIVVKDNEQWLNQNIEQAFSDNQFFRIVVFYIIHSPCKHGSFSGIDLEKYGWNNPWYFDKFKDKFDKVAGFKDGENYFYVEAQQDFKNKWEEIGFQDDFYKSTYPSEDAYNPRISL